MTHQASAETQQKTPPGLMNILRLYSNFQAPVTKMDCGDRCAPFNEHGVPFCCDTRHAIPTAYEAEWDYLNASTNLWHLWQGEDIVDTTMLEAQAPPNQVLIECQGHRFCQRNFRSITCRAFPFFPYIDRRKSFIGLTYYWQFEDRCWVINNLEHVTQEFIKEFIQTYDILFQEWLGEIDQFLYQSKIMRQVFGRRKQDIPLFCLDGKLRAVSTRSGQLTDLYPQDIPKTGPYKITAALRFPDEK